MKHFITLADQTKIAYHTYRDTKSPTIVMIHGITGNHKGFQYIVPELPSYRCIVPDLPGFGDSGLPTFENWSIDGLAKLANQFVELLKLPEPPIILGHSMGGLVVSSMVHQNPELFADKVILISPVPTAVQRADSRYLGTKLGALQYRLGYSTGGIGSKITHSTLIANIMSLILAKTRDKARRQEIYTHHRDNLNYFSDAKFYYALHRDISSHGSIDYARELKQKHTLLITGDKDNVTPLKQMNLFARAINPTEYLVIPDVGHLIHYEKAPEAAAAIVKFID